MDGSRPCERWVGHVAMLGLRVRGSSCGIGLRVGGSSCGIGLKVIVRCLYLAALLAGARMDHPLGIVTKVGAEEEPHRRCVCIEDGRRVANRRRVARACPTRAVEDICV